MGQQPLTGQVQGGKHRVSLPQPDGLVPVEDAVGRKENVELRVRMGGDPALHHIQIGAGLLQVRISGQHLRHRLRPLVPGQGGQVVPPLRVVPGEPLVHGLALAPAVGHQHIDAVVQDVFVDQILNIIQRIGVIEIVRHGLGEAALIPDQCVGVHAEDQPLRRLGPEEDVHQLVKLTVIAVGNGQPQRGRAEDLLHLAGAVVGGHGGAHQHRVRLHIPGQAGHLIALAEEHRLPPVRYPVVKAGVHHVHHGGAQGQHHQDSGQKAADPAAVCSFHRRLLRNWNR